MKLSVAILSLALSQATAEVKPLKRLIEWSDDFENPDKGADPPQNILGGDFIEPGSRPWLVPVVGRYFCGGSLISPSAVMTGEISSCLALDVLQQSSSLNEPDLTDAISLFYYLWQPLIVLLAWMVMSGKCNSLSFLHHSFKMFLLLTNLAIYTPLACTQASTIMGGFQSL